MVLPVLRIVRMSWALPVLRVLPVLLVLMWLQGLMAESFLLPVLAFPMLSGRMAGRRAADWRDRQHIHLCRRRGMMHITRRDPVRNL